MSQEKIGMPKPIIDLRIGDTVMNLREIRSSNPTTNPSGEIFYVICNRAYASENAGLGYLRVAPSASWVISDIFIAPEEKWVKLQVPGRDPPAHLKVAGGDFGVSFTMRI